MALREWQGPAATLTNELYAPAVMFAAGKGFINPPLHEAPGLREFLYLQSGHESFDPSALPDSYTETKLDLYQRYHRYLVYAMGLTWRVFGVSWESAKLLAVGLYVASALLVYGIFRLGMGRALALGGTLAFALSPITLLVVYNIRDFSKVPFLLAVIGLLLYLLRQPRCPRTWIKIATVLGVIAGVGLGFRRDLFVALPPIALVLVCAPLAASGYAARQRVIALATFTVAFLLAAAPVLWAFQSQGAAVYHDTIMGMSSTLDDDLGLQRAAYEKVPVKQDFYVSGIANGLARRSLLGVSNAYDNAYGERSPDERQYFVFEALRTFPADFMLRAYAAVIKVLRGVAEHPLSGMDLFGAQLRWLGVVYAMAVLSAIALRNLRLAALLLALLLYFGGITSLQYEWRHAVHLYFVPIGFFMLAWRQVWLWATRKAECPPMRLFPRAAGVAMGGVLLLVLPWLLALPWQVWQIGKLEQRLPMTVGEGLQAIPTRAVAWGEWTYFQPLVPIPSVLPEPPVDVAHFRPLYLMVEFESYMGFSPMEVLMQTESGAQDFSTLARACPVADVDGIRIRYYFNVPEFHGPTMWGRFDAIGIPTQFANRFHGLYLVTTTGNISINPSFARSEEPALNRRFQRLGTAFGNGGPFPQPQGGLPPARAEAAAIYQLIGQGKLDEAKARIEERLAAGLVLAEMHLALARIAQLQGGESSYREALLRGMEALPQEPALAYAYEGALQAEPDAIRESAWRQAEQAAPENPVVKVRLGLTKGTTAKP